MNKPRFSFFHPHPENRQITRRIIALGTPLLFGQLSRYFHQIADSAMLGHFGEGSLELGALGIASLFTWIMHTFLWPLSAGTQAIAGRRFGRQETGSDKSAHHTGEALDNGIITALYAAAAALAFSFSAPLILRPLISNSDIFEMTLQYIGIMRISLVPTGLFIVLQGFFGAINKTRYIMYAGILSNLLNILLNWICIFGRLGLPAMGIRGAALGTVLSNVISMLFLLLILYRRGYREMYQLFTFRRIDSDLQKDIIRVALPPGIQNIIALGIFMVYQTIIEDYSTVYLAATHSLFAFMRLNKTVIGGFARAAAILTGNALGRENRNEAGLIAGSAGRVGFLIALAVAFFSLVFRGVLARFFTNDPATQAAIERAVIFFVGFYFVESIGYTFEMIFIANGYGTWVLFSEFTTNVVFILGATLISRLLFPGNILYAWLSFGLYQLFHAFFMILGYLRGRWIMVEVERKGRSHGTE